MRSKLSRFVVGICVFGLGCSAYQRASSIDKTFLEDVDTSKKLENLPFSHSWVWADFTKGDYQAIYLKPVRVDKLKTNAWETNSSTLIRSKADYLAKAAEIAKFFHTELTAEMMKRSDFHYHIVDQAGPGVAVIEIAITELELAHPMANAATYASPIPGTGMALSTITNPHVAFAMRITDGETDQLIATMADRKFPPARIIDVNELTVSSSAREICDDWSTMIVDTFQKGRFAKVENRGVFKLKPW